MKTTRFKLFLCICTECFSVYHLISDDIIMNNDDNEMLLTSPLSGDHNLSVYYKYCVYFYFRYVFLHKKNIFFSAGSTFPSSSILKGMYIVGEQKGNDNIIHHKRAMICMNFVDHPNRHRRYEQNSN